MITLLYSSVISPPCGHHGIFLNFEGPRGPHGMFSYPNCPRGPSMEGFLSYPTSMGHPLGPRGVFRMGNFHGRPAVDIHWAPAGEWASPAGLLWIFHGASMEVHGAPAGWPWMFNYYLFHLIQYLMD